MTKEQYDRILQTAGFLLALVVAIPVLYNFEKQGFFWQTDVAERPIQQQQNIQSNGKEGL
ncbi:MAG: hypothetical protein EAZ78_26700 [Oscillatoriales cyanobacterium]|uniref:hypothetical protein n=1 Tax=Microcoleus anatoxicus TaxID=2705319 RepID=UPI0029706230|nr:MAG: hypothetical protein EAZ96_26740 [Oscillatoriales cyanobacterium]TAE96649.1 MAG: hypothetical protein EAZ78_26700 [Oscillatoriales cyanobacterium]TAF46031.1 MAG: hypothetical protein EAZ68_04350 [Oscillatoriales cyanobacterium]TAG90832.1 MAG: hypothetical protein EAZ18_18425 [Oscillatoriales cyanobacterium]TAH18631.1 MAG: hypothetical protein EAZ09_17900 [Oscillatoriales cyanobacterium]